MAVRSNSYNVWILTGAFLGFAGAMIVRPEFWWLGLISGMLALGFVRALPTLFLALVMLFLYGIRRTVQCRLVYVALAGCLVSGALWYLLFLYGCERFPIVKVSLPGCVFFLSFLPALFLAIFSVIIIGYLVVLMVYPKGDPDDDAQDWSHYAWRANPLVLAWILARYLVDVAPRIIRWGLKSPGVTIGAGLAIGSGVNHVLDGQAVTGAVVGFVLGVSVVVFRRGLVTKSA